MKLSLALILLLSSLSHAGTESAESHRKTWGGYWWSMKNAELALGWTGKHDRKKWTPDQIELFDSCLTSKTASCENIIKQFSENNGRNLSPLMKFDLYMKRFVEMNYPDSSLLSYYSHAAMNELKIHYIGNNRNHPHWNSKGFAGKCIGWALSTFDYNEPTTIKNIYGIDFTPADIKGYLATIYNGAQFFVPDELVSGTEYRNQGQTSAAYKDVLPLNFIRALRETIGKGSFLEADLDPGRGVWNYPIHKYDIEWDRTSKTEVAVKISIEFANDEVKMDDVFTNQSTRTDMKKRTYTASLIVDENWNENLLTASEASWTGKSITNHPDAIILGLQDDWREEILEYEDTNMATEVNFELLKSHDGFYSVIDNLINEYY